MRGLCMKSGVYLHCVVIALTPTPSVNVGMGVLFPPYQPGWDFKIQITQ